MRSRKICVVTGSRAEYGLLYWLLKEIETDLSLDLQLIVTGSHLEEAHGKTVREIEGDGFVIDARVPLDPQGDSGEETAATMARALSGIAEALAHLKPDLLMVLGDRYEILAAAEAAMLVAVPVAHIHGGELTEGAMDEAMRHAVTKMSHLHFTAANSYRQRVIQMGENPNSVFVSGAIGIDNIKRLNLIKQDDLSKSLGFDLARKFLLVTYHPETLADDSPGEAVEELLAAIDNSGFAAVITGVNADPGNKEISTRLTDFAKQRNGKVLLVQSLGKTRYLSAMKHCAAVVGNSSSGIIEAPAFPVPTVNIGDRQKGRLRTNSIIDCGPGRAEITAAIRRAIGPEFGKAVCTAQSPYGCGGTAERITTILKEIDLDGILLKTFYDLPIVP